MYDANAFKTDVNFERLKVAVVDSSASVIDMKREKNVSKNSEAEASYSLPAMACVSFDLF